MKKGDSITLEKNSCVLLFEDDSRIGKRNMPLYFNHHWLEEDIEGKIIKVKKFLDTNDYSWLLYKISTNKFFITKKRKVILRSVWIVKEKEKVKNG